MINCIIIDDEQFAVDVLLKYIKLMPKLDVVAIYLKPEIALEFVNAYDHIDIVFMDIDMPNLSGIEMAKMIKSKTDKLIFTTSHSSYAFDAYEVEGDAFLLKPFSFAKFAATVNRFFPFLNETFRTNDFFLVKNKDDDLRIAKVRFAEVIAFESINNYVKIHLHSDRFITAYLNLKDISDLIRGQEEFMQVHRAFIISTQHIDSLTNNSVILKNNLNINVGEVFKEKFSQFLTNSLIKTSRKIK